MAVYIYENIDQLTTNYHSGGGLVIIANRDPQQAWTEHLKRIASEHPSNAIYLTDAIIQTLPKPDRTIPSKPGEPEQIHIFPDAGCC